MSHTTLRQEIESTLRAAGVSNSEELASAIMNRVWERVRQATSRQPVSQGESAHESAEKLTKVLESLK